MGTSGQFLPPDIEAAVQASHGGPISVPGLHGNYVVMNAEVYVGAWEATEADLADSLDSIKRSLAQAAAGQSRDANEAFDEIEARYGS